MFVIYSLAAAQLLFVTIDLSFIFAFTSIAFGRYRVTYKSVLSLKQ